MAAKTPAPKAPLPEPNGVYGSHTPVDDRYLFGTMAEIMGRNDEGYATSPAKAAPHFQQIRPEMTSRNANEPQFKQYQADSKFGRPRRYI